MTNPRMRMNLVIFSGTTNEKLPLSFTSFPILCKKFTYHFVADNFNLFALANETNALKY